MRCDSPDRGGARRRYPSRGVVVPGGRQIGRGHAPAWDDLSECGLVLARLGIGRCPFGNEGRKSTISRYCVLGRDDAVPVDHRDGEAALGPVAARADNDPTAEAGHAHHAGQRRPPRPARRRENLRGAPGVEPAQAALVRHPLMAGGRRGRRWVRARLRVRIWPWGAQTAGLGDGVGTPEQHARRKGGPRRPGRAELAAVVDRPLPPAEQAHPGTGSGTGSRGGAAGAAGTVRGSGSASGKLIGSSSTIRSGLPTSPIRPR